MKNIDAVKQRIDQLIKMVDIPTRRGDDWRIEGIKHLLEESQTLLKKPEDEYESNDGTDN